jgi:hypothetical protein
MSRILLFQKGGVEAPTRRGGFDPVTLSVGSTLVFGKLEPAHAGCYRLYVASGMSRILLFPERRR